MLVVGDVNSTLACALTAKKLNLRVAHVEAGLRSGDMTMPEEINRICTDAISDVLFTTDRGADENLKREGVPEARIHFVGNVMIDTLLGHLDAARKARLWRQPRRRAASATRRSPCTGRPMSTDATSSSRFSTRSSTPLPDQPILFPVHPRTRQRLQPISICLDRFDEERSNRGIRLLQPLGYVEFLGLNSDAGIVLTDSGGLQEETTILGVPCVTLRENTERPVTVEQGTNRLAGTTRAGILAAIAEAMQNVSCRKHRGQRNGTVARPSGSSKIIAERG